MDFLERVDEVACLADIISHGVWNEFVDHFLEFTAGHRPLDDVHHLLADVLHLLVLGIGGLAALTCHLLSESNAEHSQHVSISGLHITVGFNTGLLGNLEKLNK